MSRPNQTSLYLVNDDDGQFQYVEAPDFPGAIKLWKAWARVAFECTADEPDPEPVSLECVHTDPVPVIRDTTGVQALVDDYNALLIARSMAGVGGVAVVADELQKMWAHRGSLAFLHYIPGDYAQALEKVPL